MTVLRTLGFIYGAAVAVFFLAGFILYAKRSFKEDRRQGFSLGYSIVANMILLPVLYAFLAPVLVPIMAFRNVFFWLIKRLGLKES